MPAGPKLRVRSMKKSNGNASDRPFFLFLPRPLRLFHGICVFSGEFRLRMRRKGERGRVTQSSDSLSVHSISAPGKQKARPCSPRRRPH